MAISKPEGRQLMTDIATITDPLSTAFALAGGEGETFWWESRLFTVMC
jgi:hypothetical protein